MVATSILGYDLAGRLTGLAHVQGETDLAGYTWDYNSAGRLTRQESLLDGAVDYSFDALGQLTGSDYDGLQQSPL